MRSHEPELPPLFPPARYNGAMASPKTPPPTALPYSDWVALRLEDGKEHSAWLVPPSSLASMMAHTPPLLMAPMTPGQLADALAAGVQHAFLSEHPGSTHNHFWPDRYEEGRLPGFAWSTLRVGVNRARGWGPATSRRFVHDAFMASFPDAIPFLGMAMADWPRKAEGRNALMLGLRAQAGAILEARQLALVAPPVLAAKARSPRI